MPLFGKKSRKSKRSSLPETVDDSFVYLDGTTKNVETASEASESSFYPDLIQDPMTQRSSRPLSLNPIPETTSIETSLLVRFHTYFDTWSRIRTL